MNERGSAYQLRAVLGNATALSLAANHEAGDVLAAQLDDDAHVR